MSATMLSPSPTGWPIMSADRYAALETSGGAFIVKQGPIHWRRVRRYFYRPLLPYLKYGVESTAPTFEQSGIFQHAVPDGDRHNSYFNPIIFDDLQNYEMGRLKKNVLRDLNFALKQGIAVARITDEQEFCEKAHPVYLSFYERTQYGFATYRRESAGFARWARTLFQFPELVILGAFRGEELLGFEMSCLIGDTVILKSVVHAEKGVSLHTPDLLLHHWRVMARNSENISMIYDGPMSASGVDNFKIRRGARPLALPAYLHANPLLRLAFRAGGNSIFRKLLGHTPQELARTS